MGLPWVTHIRLQARRNARRYDVVVTIGFAVDNVTRYHVSVVTVSTCVVRHLHDTCIMKSYHESCLDL